MAEHRGTMNLPTIDIAAITTSDPEHTFTSLRYKPKIDGLRAISVALVVLFHAGIGPLHGGFIGVDVFFVISGYLITALLVRELQLTGSIDLRAFWARRMRRILPAASLVLCSTLLLAAAILAPLDLRKAASDLPAAALYYINWRFADALLNYFEQDTLSLYLHYWSLAIEEQFYLCWPIIFVGVSALSILKSLCSCKATLTFAVASVFIASFFYCLSLLNYNQPLAFYSTFSRAWEFCIGAFIAFYGFNLSSRYSAISEFIGLTFIVIAAALFSSHMLYPGVAALLPTAGAAMVIVASEAQQTTFIVDSILASKIFTGVGKISYPLYLWHWPVLQLGKAYSGQLTTFGTISLIALSVLLSIFTYVFVEKPVRFGAFFRHSSNRAILGALVLSVVVTGFGIVARNSFARSDIVLNSGQRLSIDDILDARGTIYHDGCHLEILQTDYKSCSYGSSRKRVVLFGDSIAAAWFPGVEAAAAELHWQLFSRTKSACTPFEADVWINLLNRSYFECNIWRKSVLSEMARINPDVIIIAGNSGTPVTNPNGDGPIGDAEALTVC